MDAPILVIMEHNHKGIRWDCTVQHMSIPMAGCVLGQPNHVELDSIPKLGHLAYFGYYTKMFHTFDSDSVLDLTEHIDLDLDCIETHTNIQFQILLVVPVCTMYP